MIKGKQNMFIDKKKWMNFLYKATKNRKKKIKTKDMDSKQE